MAILVKPKWPFGGNGVMAANSANMFSVAAAYGFIDDPSKIKEWGSDYTINSPLDLKNLIT